MRRNRPSERRTAWCRSRTRAGRVRVAAEQILEAAVVDPVHAGLDLRHRPRPVRDLEPVRAARRVPRAEAEVGQRLRPALRGPVGAVRRLAGGDDVREDGAVVRTAAVTEGLPVDRAVLRPSRPRSRGGTSPGGVPSAGGSALTAPQTSTCFVLPALLYVRSASPLPLIEIRTAEALRSISCDADAPPARTSPARAMTTAATERRPTGNKVAGNRLFLLPRRSEPKVKARSERRRRRARSNAPLATMSASCSTVCRSSASLLKKCGPRRTPASGRKSQMIPRSPSSRWTAAWSGVSRARCRRAGRARAGLATPRPRSSSSSISSEVSFSDRSRIRGTPTSSITS